MIVKQYSKGFQQLGYEKFRQNLIGNLFVNEFGVAPDSLIFCNKRV